MTPREHTRTVRFGGLSVGGGAPVRVESMTNTPTLNVAQTLAQIVRLADAGCEIVRVAVPDEASATALRSIKSASPIPIVADIHFHYPLALAAIDNGADGIRINPGNFPEGSDRLRAVADAAKRAGIPIRVGANGGSLAADLHKRYGGVTPEALCESALRQVRRLESCGFEDIVLSVKLSDVPRTVETYRLLCAQVAYPTHIGITEAGTPRRGVVKSAVGIGALLAMGIGDTLRVSLTGDPVAEIPVARDILQAMGLRRFYPTVIACPTCARTGTGEAEKLIAMAERIERALESASKTALPHASDLTVAVMGCEVNGPGEAREADFGLALGKGKGLLFRKGEKAATLPTDDLEGALLKMVMEHLSQYSPPPQ